MSVDKLVDSAQLDSDLTSVANAIRTKGGTAASLAFPSGFVTAIDAIPTGGGGDSKEDAIIEKTISGAYTNNRVTSIGSYAFRDCSSLKEVSFPNVTSIMNYAFYSCSRLAEVNFQNATSIGNSAFYSCTSLATASFPNVTTIGGSAFYSCTSLATASFPNVTSIMNYAFFYCRMLSALYLLGSSVASLANTNAFYSTPMSNSAYLGHFGSIYVPASLVDTYKTANNWSYYADRITAYEG